MKIFSDSLLSCVSILAVGHKGLSIRKQCELLCLHRSNVYYEPVEVSDETIEVMHRIDGIFTDRD
ncbi:MAG: hypothetical protein QY310_00665 [Candidatus Jettenia sp. CY-1]|nr:hypothetical protein [Candidatus Jettenia sp.]WKZ19085.1 MAG: hypothetical protein QY310_00665 [Candidatus Jettenia sp. CY-1]